MSADAAPRGAPPYVSDDKTRGLVRTAAGYGLPQKMIAVLAGISVPTLEKYYGQELKDGEATATFEVAKTLYTRATTGKDLGAAIFWLKARAGWREKHVLDDPETRKTLADLVLMSGLSMTAPPQPEDPAQPETLQ